MSCVFNLGNVFELIVDGFDERPLPQQYLVDQGHESVVHVAANGGHQLHALFP